MRRPHVREAFAALLGLVALAGCDSTPPPSVSGSTSEVTVSGKVTYKGQPVTEGEIKFDPANIQRRDARQVSAPIGKDGAYSIKTLQGGNQVTFVVPNLARQDPALAPVSFEYDAPSGGSTKDFELSPPKP